jgi:hypothetical protein
MTVYISSLVGNRPRIDKLQASFNDKGDAVISGEVTFELARSPHDLALTGQVSTPKLTFPFSNAKSEAEAIQQASKQLKAVADTFLVIAGSLLDQHRDAQK